MSEMPAPPPASQNNRRRNIIIIAVVGAVLLCCCCLVAVGAYYAVNSGFLEDLLYELDLAALSQVFS